MNLRPSIVLATVKTGIFGKCGISGNFFKAGVAGEFGAGSGNTLSVVVLIVLILNLKIY